MKRGNILRLEIERLSPDGSGYAEVEGRSISVKGAITGDVVDVNVVSVKRHTAIVKLQSVVSSGIERIAASCPHYSVCGGCKWQDVPYNIQCDMKSGIVQAALDCVPEIGNVQDIAIKPSPDQFYYRNKMEFSFDSPPSAEGRVFLGLHEAGRYDSVFDVENCLLQHELSNTAVDITRRYVAENGLTAYGLKSHKGLMRYFVVRDAKNTGDIMINIVTSGDDFPGLPDLADKLIENIPGLKTVVRSIHHGMSSVAIGQEREIIYGNGYIHERIGDCTFQISPDSFFQTNAKQTENLYDTIKELCKCTGTERLLDLYCGTGTIGIYCAGEVKSVTGVEVVDSAVEDAKVNVKLNSVSNITFMSGQVEKTINESFGDYDVVVCDPPRAGIHPKALTQLLMMRIPRMVYVSCNVKALPHDLELLAMAGYRLKDVRAFDMSPHTPHIETVLLLEID